MQTLDDPETKTLSGADKDALWKELKSSWDIVKKETDVSKKDAAKKRINEIQETLGLKRTTFGEGGERSSGSFQRRYLTVEQKTKLSKDLIENMVPFLQEYLVKDAAAHKTELTYKELMIGVYAAMKPLAAIWSK